MGSIQNSMLMTLRPSNIFIFNYSFFYGWVCLLPLHLTNETIQMNRFLYSMLRLEFSVSGIVALLCYCKISLVIGIQSHLLTSENKVALRIF